MCEAQVERTVAWAAGEQIIIICIIMSSCGKGDDPLSRFLLDGAGGSPTADPCMAAFSSTTNSTGSISQRVLPLSPPTKNEASTTTRSATNGEETVTTLETPQQRASRLLAMCDERGVGANTGDDKILKRCPESNTNPARSLKTSIAQLLGSSPINSENSFEGNGAEDALFNESVASVESLDETLVYKENGVSDSSAPNRFVSAEFVPRGNENNIDIDALLRSNDILEDENQRLRTLLTKRTLVLEAEKSKMISELSHIRDAHREELERVESQSKQCVADLMSRTEYLKRSINDQREICDVLTKENQQLRFENHYLRMKQSDSDRVGYNSSSDSNTTGHGWLSRWGGGRKVEQAASSASLSECASCGELHGNDLAPTKEIFNECASQGSGGSSSTASTCESNANLMIKKNVFAKTNTGEKTKMSPPPFGNNVVEEDGDNGFGDGSAQSEADKPAHDRSDLGGLVGGLVQSTRSLLSTWDDGIHKRHKGWVGSIPVNNNDEDPGEH